MISPEDLPVPESLSTLLALRNHPIQGRRWMSSRAGLYVNRTTHAPIVADLLIIMLPISTFLRDTFIVCVASTSGRAGPNSPFIVLIVS